MNIRPFVKYNPRTGEKAAGAGVSLTFDQMANIFSKVGGFFRRLLSLDPQHGAPARPSIPSSPSAPAVPAPPPDRLQPIGPPYRVKASNFAGPKDLEGFRKAKARGLTDEQAFAFGDNGIGCWEDDTAGAEYFVALPPEVMREAFGSVAQAKHKPVLVTWGGRSLAARVGDRMPHLANIRNGCRIDLNWSLAQALGIRSESWTGDVCWQRLA